MKSAPGSDVAVADVAAAEAVGVGDNEDVTIAVDEVAMLASGVLLDKSTAVR